MRKSIIFLVVLSVIVFKAKAQTSLCNGASPFCTGTTYNFPAPVTGNYAQPGIDYGCLLATPNPVWYYLKVATSGPIILNISGTSTFDDIDFVCWGPFTSETSGCIAQLTNACTGIGFGCPSNTSAPPGTYPSGNMVDCSFDSQPTEICTIPNALAGQYYLVLITNYKGSYTTIIFNQTNAGAAGAGATDCSIMNLFNGLTVAPSACSDADNTYSLTGTVSFTNAPTTGSLTVTSSCGGTSQVFTAPFTSPLNYTIPGLLSNGGACSVSASFSAIKGYAKTFAYTAPVSCVSCTVAASNNSPVCELQALHLLSSAPNASVTMWNGPNGYASSAVSPTLTSAPLKASGMYTLTIVAANTATCMATTPVIIHPLPVPDFSLAMPVGEQDYVISGANLSLGCSYFHWNIDDKTKILTNNFSYDFTSGGKYPLCLYVENSFGCSSTKCTTVDFKDWAFYIPDSFTPNNDNLNDRLYVFGYGISEVYLEIYNRWGTTIFLGNGLEDGWPGLTDDEGHPVKQDTYTWKVSFKDVNNLQHNYVGRVMVLK